MGVSQDRGSNSGPLRYECNALPTELPWLFLLLVLLIQKRLLKLLFEPSRGIEPRTSPLPWVRSTN